MNLYFKLKVFSEYIVPVIIIGLILLYGLFAFMKSWLRNRLMKKLGYKYNRQLGTNVAYEFQPHWEKGKVKIHYRKIDALKYSQIKSYVRSREEE